MLGIAVKHMSELSWTGAHLVCYADSGLTMVLAMSVGSASCALAEGFIDG
jgi:hypothetical protein